jgi:hypothetical protein
MFEAEVEYASRETTRGASIAPFPLLRQQSSAQSEDSPPVDGEPRDVCFRGLVEEHCRRAGELTSGWIVEPAGSQSETWIVVRRAGGDAPTQGWKLHVSAGVASAESVLHRVLPVLLADDADFKVAASLRVLDDLNDGRATLSQVGKFVTVYPRDDAHAVRLAVALDTATCGLRGPGIPSDRPLRPGSLVHYRYGAFGGRMMQTPLGETAYAVVAPDGELVLDRRLAGYQAPAWAVDPFVVAGVAQEPAAPGPLIANRFLVLATLHRSSRGAVFRAIDVDAPRRCVLKQARRDAQMAADGTDARDALRYEAEILQRLGQDAAFPTMLGLVEQDGDLYLAIDDIDGETLERRVAELISRGCTPPVEQLVGWGRELAAILSRLHRQGLVYRDLKPSNVIVAPDGALHLIDCELVRPIGAAGRSHGLGTFGYMPQEQEAGAPSAMTDDVYALGALLVFLATGAEPSHAPRRFSLLDRPLTLLNPAVGPDFAGVVAGCLEPDPSSRFRSMDEVEAALAAATGVTAPRAPFGGEEGTESDADARSRARVLARRLGETLRAAARRPPHGNGVYWQTGHRVAGGIPLRDVNIGNAGTLLALAELADEFADPALREALSDGADWLAQVKALEGDPVPGLYVGEAGIAAALLRAGQVLGRAELVDLAAERGRWIGSLPHRSPDLFNGTAGRLRFHLMLWDETGDPAALDDAVAAGERLLAMAEEAGAGGMKWTIPPGYGSLSGSAGVGYAHGAAGIGDALLDLWEATGDERYLVVARGAACWLRRLAVPTLSDGSGLGWPSDEGQPPVPAFWCHGATGVGRFLLHADRLGLLEDGHDLVARAARAVARGTRWAGPTQCHGLAGNIEFLLDVYQSTEDPAYLSEARSLGRLLEAFGQERDGLLVWPSESPWVVTPDYMVGYAGVAACFLRLADAARRPQGLSRAGFRFRSTARAMSAANASGRQARGLAE